MAKLTNAVLEAAIYGFEAQKKDIDVQIAELRAMMNGATQASTEEAPAKRKKRKISPEALKRMREGQKRRWAKIRGESSSEPAKNAAPAKAPVKMARPKRKISAAGLKAIAEAQKKRWAAKKAMAA
jgi:hypothetical protein